MRLIDKLVLLDLAGPFTTGMMMFLLLLFAAAGLFPATELLVQGVPFWTVMRIVVYNLPSMVTQTLPMAMLLAGLMGFGRLSADREAVAVFAAGVSFPRAVRSVFAMGAVVSVVAFFWNDLVVPPASTAYNNLRQEVQKHLRSSEQALSYSVPAAGSNGVDEFVYVAGGYDARTQTLRHVTIVKYITEAPRRGQPEAVIYCDRAMFTDQKGLNATYLDGYCVTFTGDPRDPRSIDYPQVLDFDALKTLPYSATLGKSFEGVLSSEITDPNRKSFAGLRAEIIADRKLGQDTRGKEVDLYGKLALPLASLIFGVVGAALGLNTQRGGGRTVGFGLAIFIVFLYWVFYHAMFVVGQKGGLPPVVASFLADFVGAVAGVFLSLRASR